MIAMQAAGDATIEPLYSVGDIQRRIDELARDIAASSLKEPLIVAILKGSFIFAADLIRALHREGLGARDRFSVPGELRRGHRLARRSENPARCLKPD